MDSSNDRKWAVSQTSSTVFKSTKYNLVGTITYINVIVHDVFGVKLGS